MLRTRSTTTSGLCHGWLGWFSIELGGAWLSTSPYEDRTHWSPAFMPLDPPVMLEKSERVSFKLDRAPFGDWTWTISSERSRQQHSTLLNAPMTPDALAKACVRYAPEDKRPRSHAASCAVRMGRHNVGRVPRAVGPSPVPPIVSN